VTEPAAFGRVADPAARPRVAVIGAGWAGLAAAVELCDAGCELSLFEMAAEAGGRARGVDHRGSRIDNGQHIMIGAYRASLALMTRLGIDADRALKRLPLTLRYPDGRGLALRPGPPWLAFPRAIASARGWTWSERLALLRTCAGWLAAGFHCGPDLTVSELCADLPAALRTDLIEPLCVAALNTRADQASAEVWLRILRDTLFGGRGSADLLLPRATLDQLLPAPALAWLRERGAAIELGRRVHRLETEGAGWRVDGVRFDRVVLACSSTEAARLVRPLSEAWATLADELQFEPIVTVHLQASGARLPVPMMALSAGVEAPAQFLFDHGALSGADGRLAAVISAAAPWLERGLQSTAAATMEQIAREFASQPWARSLRVVATLADKRATFRCSPRLRRPSAAIAPGLWAAGDYVDGPYPATLEGAVRSGSAVGIAAATGPV